MNILNSVIEREPLVCFTQIGDHDIVVLNSIDDQFYHLNESAVDLWLALDCPQTVLALSQILTQKYCEPLETYHSDILEWIEDNKQKGLLVIKDHLDAKTNS